ncbi:MULTISPECIES: oxidoreductase [unclassified Sphingomonas]|uniref:oxidoreductase n=1 Tax=unclassified Sphingomonas TaxID=196159 RepID=UPI00226A2301|nr:MULTISPECIES: oxidoreductase [unclassified Sphingomonas]
MPDPINVALIGYGYAGRTFHAPLIRATPGLHLAAVVSSRPAAVHAALGDIVVVADIDTVLADPAIDLVVVATPDALHARHALAALDAGKHVVVDKPFALSLAEARAMTGRAQDRGLTLSVFHNRRWDSDFLTLRHLIDQGVLGTVTQVESHFDRFRPEVRDRWREQPGAGIWRDLGPHLVDQALQLFGPPLAVYADLGMQRAGAVATDYFHVLLRYPQLRVILHASVLTPASWLRLAVHGSRGSFIKYGFDLQEAALAAGQPAAGEGWGTDPVPGQLTVIGEDGLPAGATLETVPGDYRRFYAGIRDCLNGAGPNPVPPDQALAVMAVLDAAIASADQQREILLTQ